jgi:hypothetical protein
MKNDSLEALQRYENLCKQLGIIKAPLVIGIANEIPYDELNKLDIYTIRSLLSGEMGTLYKPREYEREVINAVKNFIVKKLSELGLRRDCEYEIFKVLPNGLTRPVYFIRLVDDGIFKELAPTIEKIVDDANQLWHEKVKVFAETL